MEGLGQHDAAFASPDAPSGFMDYSSIAGVGDEGTILTGQSGLADTGLSQLNVSGLYPEADHDGAGLHISTGPLLASSHPGRRAQHWSNLIDFRHGPLGWMLLLTIVYFGLVSIHLGARFGQTRAAVGTR